MAKRLRLKVKWIPPDDAPEGHAPSPRVFARLLWPELFRLTDSVPEVLALADRLLKEPGQQTKKAEALSRKAELEAELARINAQLEEDLITGSDSPGADCSSQNSPAV